MELELKVTAESPRELIKIAAKLSDLDAILKDDIPFMPEGAHTQIFGAPTGILY